MAPSGYSCLLSQSWFGKEVRHSLKGLCRRRKLQENEKFQKFKMKMLPASMAMRGERLVSEKAKQQVKDVK